MKALSIKQPWAALIINGLKPCENRIWATNVRGRIAVHAGKNVDTWAMEYFAEDIEELPPHTLETGALVGTVEIVGCDEEVQSDWDDTDGFHFRLANPIALDKPVPYKGMLKFFNVDDKLLDGKKRRTKIEK